ncbi:Not1 N-terminal domain, CCR4-Not complex component-domain-containing protein [Gaertneriomyces semiglobifer]|nr:Not1 N-terminal domain, CCR4-Not complex component-domain-containing protein [Gaertneriomyces semiglobifer]
MANRKLLGEIDKVLKRVSEGVEAFRETFDKLDAATTPAQKEKYEGDLKKEIKKLQRLRDQIRGWLSSSEIKDKRALEDNRRLIEEQMERFKAAEKALKLKAFSKEGLLQPQKYDPEVKEREDLEEWIAETVKELNRQVEIFEAEQESLQVAMRRGRKGGDAAKAERLSEIDHHVDRHKWHMMQLEIIQRMLANEELKTDQVKEIKEDVDYYVKSNQDPDFDENEYIYEDLNLENIEVEAYGIKTDDVHDNNVDEPSTPPKEKEPEATTPAREDIHDDSAKRKPSKDKDDEITTPSKTKPSTRTAKTPVTAKTPAKVVTPVPRPTVPTPRPAEPVPPPSMTVRYSAAAAASTPVTDGPKIAQPTSLPSRSAATTAAPVATSSRQATPAAATRVNTQSAPSAGREIAEPSPTNIMQAAGLQKSKDDATPETIESRLPASLADLVHSFEATRERSTKPKEIADARYLQNILTTSLQFLPDPLDSERPKHYFPKNPYPVPSYYPQTPLPYFDSPGMFEKFDLDVLFFIFYYHQGTYQQYLAARELKRQSWRFHKKFLTWFQRAHEPTQITDEFEQGTYIYFDYEGEWCQKRKTEFRFEYRYLEDAEM